jgi:hypothetical protein
MSLIKLIENFKLDNVFTKQSYQVVLEAFSISENTAVVDVLLLNFNVM